MYEHLLSFDAELRVIWGRKLNLPNILFLLNRYLMVLDYVLNISTVLPVSDKVYLPLSFL